MSFCAKCFKTVKHEGTPEGTITQIAGVKCYVATLRVAYPKEKAVIFLPDVFGLELPNTQFLADDLVRSGFKTIIPDIMNGDPVLIHGITSPVVRPVTAGIRRKEKVGAQTTVESFNLHSIGDGIRPLSTSDVCLLGHDGLPRGGETLGASL
ncbi:hypothetical protein B0H17DRAFT_1259697 [Mycena rosella]|uniref:Dienelactone hydrolase domain-containing protein n=1 Tax=Mycena rosella TaxID=1033263 RepID=A0AAD7CSJ5_MYCRO|nr:hypothetical protein B0H17DRAFT_1259697 [Mycena rosella]